jgi:hypothetical protein
MSDVSATDLPLEVVCLIVRYAGRPQRTGAIDHAWRCATIHVFPAWHSTNTAFEYGRCYQYLKDFMPPLNFGRAKEIAQRIAAATGGQRRKVLEQARELATAKWERRRKRAASMRRSMPRHSALEVNIMPAACAGPRTTWRSLGITGVVDGDKGTAESSAFAYLGRCCQFLLDMGASLYNANTIVAMSPADIALKAHRLWDFTRAYHKTFPIDDCDCGWWTVPDDTCQCDNVPYIYSVSDATVMRGRILDDPHPSGYPERD